MLVAQVGDPGIEAMTWDRPEYLNETSKRPVSLITWQNPGSDVVAEVAAAFAATSLAFENIGTSTSDFLKMMPNFVQNLYTSSYSIFLYFYSLTDGSYKDILLKRAKSLFTFASTYKGIYTEHVRSAIRQYK